MPVKDSRLNVLDRDIPPIVSKYLKLWLPDSGGAFYYVEAFLNPSDRRAFEMDLAKDPDMPSLDECCRLTKQYFENQGIDGQECIDLYESVLIW